MRGLKMRYQTAGVENAGLENAGNDIVWNAAHCLCLLVLQEASVDCCHTSCVRLRRDGVGMLVSLRSSCNETIEEDRFVGRVQ